MAIRIVIKPATRVRIRKIGILALWLFGGGALIGAAFIFSFYMAMKIEMRSTEVAVPDLTNLSMEEASTSRRTPRGSTMWSMYTTGCCSRRWSNPTHTSTRRSPLKPFRIRPVI